MRAGIGACLALAVWSAATGRADAVLVEVVGADQATGALVLVSGDLETLTVTAPDASLRLPALTSGVSGRTDLTQPYGPLFANVTMWQQSAGLIDVTSGLTGDAPSSGTAAASGSDSSSGSGASINAASGTGMPGTIEGTLTGTIGTIATGTLNGTIGPTATVTLQGTVTDPSPVPLPPSAGLFAAGAAAWAGWWRWMRGLKTG
jgi:hypothetical protein